MDFCNAGPNPNTITKWVFSEAMSKGGAAPDAERLERRKTMVSRERIYEVLTSKNDDDRVTNIYNYSMMILIVLWMLPLWFKERIAPFQVLDYFCAAVFIVDYLLRWATADFKLKRGKMSFLLYPFTPMAILDLLSLLPTFAPADQSLKVARILKVMGALRAFKLIRHSKSIRMLFNAVRNQRVPLIVSLVLAAIYIVACATVMFNVEPETYDSFLDALYWSVISLTTVGYGDITPTTAVGRIVAMLSALAGVAIIAFPSGIIAAGMISELNTKDPEQMTERTDLAKQTEKTDQADQTDQIDQTG